MQNIVNQRCVAGGGQCLYKHTVLFIDRGSVVPSRFNLLKKTKKVLGTKKIIFIFCVYTHKIC